MRRKFVFAIGLLASVAAGGGSALAADLPVRPAPQVAASPAYVPDWVGFYVGIHGGGGWGHTSFDPGFFETGMTPFVPPDASPKGGVFGFQFGRNWQWGSVVGGLEIDFSGADIKETSTFFFPGDSFDAFTRSIKIDELASARGRLGYLIFPNWLLYGTAGTGWGHFRLNTAASDPTVGFLSSAASFTNEFGWVAGVGLEWKFWDHWLLRGEWLHYDFGRTSHFDLASGEFFGTALDNANVRTTVDVARALSYKF